jgi:hypothetical protein
MDWNGLYLHSEEPTETHTLLFENGADLCRFPLIEIDARGQ